MLDIEWLRRFQLSKVPYGQILVKRTALQADLTLFGRRTQIVLEGIENLHSNGPLLVAMNHTDRFNYLPFMYMLDQMGLPPCAPWVKGKYYQNRFLGWFLNLASCIPVPSRGFVMSLDFKRVMGRPPGTEDYRILRNLVNGEAVEEHSQSEVETFLERVERASGQAFLDYFGDLFARMAGEVVRINRLALELGYRPLVFPQGTRSKRLSRGHTGIVQMAQFLGTPIVPVGVCGADLLYTGNRPFSRGGLVTYRIGKPLHPDGPELRAHRVTSSFAPLSRAATVAHGPQFEAAIEVIMNHINELLDPEYQYSETRESDGVSGVGRFL